MLYIIFFVFGTIIGSFVNALQYRIENKLSISKGRSICPNCKHELTWLDLVPLLSFVFLKGKCRYCNKKISSQYPIIEVVTGFAFLAILYSLETHFRLSLDNFLVDYNNFFGIKLVIFLTVASIMILVGLHDQKTGYVLSGYVYVAILLALFANLLNSGGSFVVLSDYLPYIYSLVCGALFFGSLYIISKGKWMGAGDIEIAALMGALLGWPSIIIALYFAFISGSVVGLVRIYKKEAKLESEMPFGPFLILGVFFALLFSDKIIDIYVRIFLGY